MGIPYSKEYKSIVSTGTDFVDTAKKVAIVAVCLQIYYIVVLSLILGALLALLVTTNPDLEEERRALVTPVVKWLASWVMWRSRRAQRQERPSTAGRAKQRRD
ncbi:hypothetical protein NHQ30_001223 [Ciborinia camelliae]|nr:hypothetical protein NHQ30_001223 [Ciborinia camelliae]